MYLPVEIISLILSYTDLGTIQKMMNVDSDDFIDVYDQMLSNYVFSEQIPIIFRKDTGEVILDFYSESWPEIKVKNIVGSLPVSKFLTTSGDYIVDNSPINGKFIYLNKYFIIDVKGELYFTTYDGMSHMINVGTDIKKVDKNSFSSIFILKNDGSLWNYFGKKLSKITLEIKLKDISTDKRILYMVDIDGNMYYLNTTVAKLQEIKIPPVVMMRRFDDVTIALDNEGTVWQIYDDETEEIIPSSYNVVTISDPYELDYHPITGAEKYSVMGIDIEGSLVIVVNNDGKKKITVSKTPFQWEGFIE